MAVSMRLAWVTAALFAIALGAARRTAQPTSAQRVPTTAPRPIEPTRWLANPTGDLRIVARRDGALFALSGALRIELTARNELAFGNDPDVAWSVARSTGEGWLFVATDGAVYRARTFTGALARTQQLSGPVERARSTDASLAIVDANGSLYVLDGDRLVRELGPPDARALLGVRSTRGVLFAMTSERHWLERSSLRARWVRTERAGEILREYLGLHAGERVCMHDFDNPCVLDPSCLDREPTAHPFEHGDLARVEHALRSAMPPLERTAEPPIEVVFAPTDAPIAAKARVVCHRESLCVQWPRGVERCERTPGLEVASHRPERGVVYRDGCAIASLVASSEPTALARTLTVCAEGPTRWTTLPEDTAGLWFFDPQRAVAWNHDRTRIHRTRDGGARWTLERSTIETRGSSRVARVGVGASGLLFDDRLWLSATPRSQGDSSERPLERTAPPAPSPTRP